MNRNYQCPICRAQIRVGDHLILSAKSARNEKGLVLLSSEIGNYNVLTHPDFEVHLGEAYQFYCPVCHAGLNDKEKQDLVRVRMEDEGVEYDVYFSHIAGEKVTFRIADKQVEEYGLDHDRYERYFDLEEKYKRYLH